MRNYTVQMNFTVPKGVKAKLRARAELEGVSMSEIVRRATRDLGESLRQ